MSQSATFDDGRTFRIGQRVSCGDILGTVIGIDDTGRVTRIKVQADSPDELPRHLRWMLNPQAAEQHGHPDFDKLRDHGLSAGNFNIIEED